ncbi:MAG: thioredoxin [Clostridiales bacterium]|nr:thioredoxin [Clostridiales bacterium]
MAELVLTSDNFKTEVLESEIPVLVDFWASWCGPCKMLGPVIAELAEEYEGKVKVGKVNIDDEEELAMEYGIQSIPTVLLFKGGEVVEQSLGFKPKAAFKAMLG